MKSRVTRALMSVALFAALITAAPTSPVNAAAGFGDVAADAFYAEPVQWMVDNEITQGTSPGCFSPDRAVSRAEAAVFLHRYAGEPAAGGEDFVDVPNDTWYTDAVAWMVTNAITTGTGPTTFDPSRNVTRAEIGTFMWRFMGRPAGGSEDFFDVNATHFFADAVAWMVDNGITQGTSPTTFSPNRDVTRGELATFMYRLAGEPSVDLSLDGSCGSSGGSGGGSGGGGSTTGRFETLGVGATLPSGAECAERVRPAAEIRPGNADENATRGSGPHPDLPRVDGDFTGTTDEILQWVACKWGIDEDVVRAQAVKESWWHMSTQGDPTGRECHWSVADVVITRFGQTGCPESLGILQVRYPYHQAAFDSAAFSTAYNADYTYALWRDCYEGRVTWLNNVERGREYAAGDLWGCLGVWFSGRYWTERAVPYIDDVERILNERTWETQVFINDPGPS